METLTPFQESFAQQAARIGSEGIENASDAYRKSLYSIKNKSAKSINEAASRLMANSKVSARISELQASSKKIAKEKFEIDAEGILKQLDVYRKANISEYVEYVQVQYPVHTRTTTIMDDIETIIETTTMMSKTEVKFKTFDQLTKDQLSCIDSIKQNRYGEIELKLHGKQWTTEMLNKYLGLYEKDNQQKAPPVVNEIDMSKVTTDTLKALHAAYKKPGDEKPE